jgi:LmeA-like phospholipid-binding
MRRAGKILIGLVLVLAVLLVAADRVGATVAQNIAESRLAQDAPFVGRPSVTIHGVPFLSQAVRGRYRDIEISGRLGTLGVIRGAALDVHLRGVQLPLTALVHRDVPDLPVDDVNGTVSISYSELARLSQIPNLTLTPHGSQLDASARVSVPVLGDDVTVTGEGSLTLLDGKIKLQITRLQAGSIHLPSTVLPAVSAAATAVIPVPNLPYGLGLTSVLPTPGGLLVAGAGRNVVLRRLS